jgi:hypothetical protein
LYFVRNHHGVQKVNTINQVTITRRGVAVFQFVVAGDASRANYLAGNALDAMADLSPIGDPLDYTVAAVPYFASMTPNGAVYAMARDAVTWR